MAIYDEAGPGRKLCTACGKYGHIRQKTCEACGALFPVKNKPVKKVKKRPTVAVAAESSDDSQTSPFGPKRIAIPAGSCPHNLNGVDEDTVVAWADRVRSSGRANNMNYTIEALRYFVRQFFDIHSVEYSQACRFLV